MMSHIGKFPITATTTIYFMLFIVLFYVQKRGFLSSNSPSLEFNPCPAGGNNTKLESNVNKAQDEAINDISEAEKECNFGNGKWVFNQSIKPLYSDRSCAYISRTYSCAKNGRLDSDYLHWEWHPQHCNLPKFDPELALKKLQGKRLLFVGDSLQQNQWESFICMVEWIIPQNQKSMKRGNIHSVFKAKMIRILVQISPISQAAGEELDPRNSLEYNASIEFYWAPMLVESNTELFVIRDVKKKIVKVDSIIDRAKYWVGVDILVFNTYVWWMNSPPIIKVLWGSFANGEEGYEELDTKVAYNLGLRTWANWVDSTINPNKTRVFFTTMSPVHTRSSDWGNNEGVKCFNETKPIMRKNHWGSGSNKDMMSVVSKVMNKMKVPITFINITQISEYRIDAHSSVFTEVREKLLTDEKKDNPYNADCVHWCLPGLPDTWNQIFLTML